MNDNRRRQDERTPAHTHRDPISGAPGAHPVGTGVGAAAAGVAGLGIGGIVAGPIGAAVGAAAGAIAGGLAGKAIAESSDSNDNLVHWRTAFRTRPYVQPTDLFEDFELAYRLGWESRARLHTSGDVRFEQAEGELARAWERLRGEHGPEWPRARHAVMDAWDRVSLERAENEGMAAPPSRPTSHQERGTGADTPPTARGSSTTVPIKPRDL